MVLAIGSKLAVHPLSNVLYHSPPARLSDLAAAHVRHDAGPFQQTRNTSICRLSHANLRRPDRWNIRLWSDSASVLFIAVACAADPAGFLFPAGDPVRLEIIIYNFPHGRRAFLIMCPFSIRELKTPVFSIQM